MNFKTLTLFLCMSLCLTSCFKDEGCNEECDITMATISVNKDIENNVFYSPADSSLNVTSNQKEITFFLKNNANIKNLPIKFKLSPFATIYPQSGSVQDFSNGPIKYVVTSQSREYKKEYLVKVVTGIPTISQNISTTFSAFSKNSEKDFKYYIINSPFETPWASGNKGYVLAAGRTPAQNYPTAPNFIDDNTTEGVSLTTCSTGFLGSLVGMPIAAGNLFLGTFDDTKALAAPLATTQFGISVVLDKKPTRLVGYYQYSPGAKMIGSKNKEDIDQGDIYAVIYKREFEEKEVRGEKISQEIFLNGENIKTSDRIIALTQEANIKDSKGEWVKFEIPFDYKQGFNTNELLHNIFNFTIVCTSSKQGAQFIGATGSNLKIKDLTIVTE